MTQNPTQLSVEQAEGLAKSLAQIPEHQVMPHIDLFVSLTVAQMDRDVRAIMQQALLEKVIEVARGTMVHDTVSKLRQVIESTEDHDLIAGFLHKALGANYWLQDPAIGLVLDTQNQTFAAVRNQLIAARVVELAQVNVEANTLNFGADNSQFLHNFCTLITYAAKAQDQALLNETAAGVTTLLSSAAKVGDLRSAASIMQAVQKASNTVLSGAIDKPMIGDIADRYVKRGKAEGFIWFIDLSKKLGHLDAIKPSTITDILNLTIKFTPDSSVRYTDEYQDVLACVAATDKPGLIAAIPKGSVVKCIKDFPVDRVVPVLESMLKINDPELIQAVPANAITGLFNRCEFHKDFFNLVRLVVASNQENWIAAIPAQAFTRGMAVSATRIQNWHQSSRRDERAHASALCAAFFDVVPWVHASGRPELVGALDKADFEIVLRSLPDDWDAYDSSTGIICSVQEKIKLTQDKALTEAYAAAMPTLANRFGMKHFLRHADSAQPPSIVAAWIECAQAHIVPAVRGTYYDHEGRHRGSGEIPHALQVNVINLFGTIVKSGNATLLAALPGLITAALTQVSTMENNSPHLSGEHSVIPVLKNYRTDIAEVDQAVAAAVGAWQPAEPTLLQTLEALSRTPTAASTSRGPVTRERQR